MQVAVDAGFATHGDAATYTPPNGQPIPCTVIARAQDRSVAFGDSRPFAQGTALDVRVSDVAQPVAGGVFTVNGTQMTVIGDPEQLDELRLIWTCRVH